MSDYVIDASVFVARAARNDPSHDTARTFVHQAMTLSWSVFVPAILLPELASGIARVTNRNSWAVRITSLVRQLPNLFIVDVDDSLSQLAVNLAVQHRLRGCDSLYVALAQFRNIPLITLDQEQRQRVPSSVIARSPAEELALIPPQSTS